MPNLSKESGPLFEKIYFQRTILQLNKKLYGLNKNRVQLLAMLPKERRAKLMEELNGLERLTERLVSRVKPADYQFVKVQVGGNQVLLSQAVLVRSKRVNKRSIYRVFVKGRINRIMNRLHLLRSNWNTYYRVVHTEARNMIMGMFMNLNKKYSVYLDSSMAASDVKGTPTPLTRKTNLVDPGSQRRVSTIKSEKKIEPLIKSQEKNSNAKVSKKVEVKKTIEKPKKTTITKESTNKSTDKKPIKTKIWTATQGIETDTPKVAPNKTTMTKESVNKSTEKKPVTNTKKPKMQQGKPPIKKEPKNKPVLEDFNEEIYLDSLEGDLESSNMESRIQQRNKYMDDMVLK